ncbi:low specificity L-threonine aldolase [Nocardioides sp.]|uniref:threonine aldolase family protein n=1 Tax=Nocardioides sp. TaxID=35761 RepID=UPI002721CDB8|nr:beta-eliminating lyase-related protein [Nocardioides sp.]MDO9457694.1 beta-eliminating lyase-related protein [Nocardioides sp.]
MDEDLVDRVRAASRSCTRTVAGRRHRSPAEVLDGLATACREFGIDEWDGYGERGAVARVEAEVAGLLGTEAAAFFPSGVMAQQVALRIWCDRAGSRRVAMPDLSHLLVHELDGPRILQHLEVEHLTTGPTVATAAHLAALPGRLAAVLVEVPLRDAGCLVPTYDELAALSAACRERDIRLHLDGARVWEAQTYLGRSLPDIAALADTVYVSFYKGLGGLAGAALLGPQDVVDEARRWRRRMGGTIYRSTPEAVSALVGLRDRLPLMGDCVRWARSLAAALPDHVVVQPPVPHTGTFLLHAAGQPEEVNRRLLAFVEEHALALTPPWSPGSEAGRVTCELAVGEDALELDPEETAHLIGELLRD